MWPCSPAGSLRGNRLGPAVLAKQNHHPKRHRAFSHRLHQRSLRLPSTRYTSIEHIPKRPEAKSHGSRSTTWRRSTTTQTPSAGRSRKLRDDQIRAFGRLRACHCTARVLVCRLLYLPCVPYGDPQAESATSSLPCSVKFY